MYTILTRLQAGLAPALKSNPKMFFTLILFFIAFVFRYLRLIVNTLAYATLTGHPRSPTPSFTSSQDVTVVIPTVFADPTDVMRCLDAVLACNPFKTVIVTSNDLISKVQTHLTKYQLSRVQIIGVAKLNKRTQMVAALQQAVQSSIVCFADDDVFWPNADFIDTMLACFENPKVGAAGPSQRVVRFANCNLWNFLGICYLERRNFNTGSTNRIDGAVSTLSGRTSFYRAHTIQSPQFYDYFLNAKNHDDDKNLTRWTFDQGWQITLQFDPSACIETTLERDCTPFLKQCMRWARGHWRGNFRVMTTTTYWFDTHIWSLYAIYIAQFQTPAFLIDTSLALLLYSGMSPYGSDARNAALYAFAAWVLFTKIIKIIPHFTRHPSDMQYIPAMILFSYFHGILNVYALLTMDNKAWGR